MKRKIAFAALALFCSAGPALAIFGLGDIVFDPTNFEEAIRQLLQLEQQYSQLVQTYQMISNQYQQMVWMAKQVPVNMAARYRAISTPWRNSSAANTYGNTASWTTGINSGLSVQEGYAGATQPLSTYGAGLGNIPGDQVRRVKASYATVELTDGANLAAMQTLGELRAHAPAVEGAIANLEQDALSPDPDMNTEIALLNKINAAGMIAVRNSQDTNKLLAALAEEQIVDAKRKRDTEAAAIDQHVQFMTLARQAMTAQAADASSAMLAWRMP
jgi:type IV secretion system protein TrbJ